MTKYIRTLMAPLALSCAIVVGACGGNDNAAADSALERDLAMANRDTSVPTPSDVPGGTTKAPATPRPSTPSTPTPRPAPTTPRGNTVTPGAGAAAERTGKDAQKVAIGAAIGAGIGQILGKDTKGTVIGAASGAAVGTAIAMGTGNVEGCIPAGGKITIALTAPATIGTGN